MDERTQQAVARMMQSPLFPLDGDLRLKALGPLMETEVVREGEGGRPCPSCDSEDRILWRNDRWKVTPLQPTANPVGLFLETVDHVDFEHFDDEMAAEFGLLTVRLEAAVRAVESVGRVHVHRWGDGSSHFHVWFQGRPARQLELYGWGNVLWSQLAEPLPAASIDRNHASVIDHLRERAGGFVPPR
ncbi:MAG: hypothetical protein AB8G26_03610 [Ilumatobacter sp.]